MEVGNQKEGRGHVIASFTMKLLLSRSFNDVKHSRKMKCTKKKKEQRISQIDNNKKKKEKLYTNVIQHPAFFLI